MTELPYGSADEAHPTAHTGPWGVAIYNVNGGSVTSQFDMSMVSLMARYLADPASCPIRQYRQRPGTSVLSMARNGAVLQFLNETDAEWMLQIDSDIDFPPDSVDRILEVAHPVDAPIICGLYLSTLPEGLTAVAWPEVDGPPYDADTLVRALKNGERLLPCERTGAGFLLVHRDVLMAMHDAAPVDPWFGEEFVHGVKQGEDFTFCVRARKLGYPIYVDIGLDLGHVKTIVWTKEMLGNVLVETRLDG